MTIASNGIERPTFTSFGKQYDTLAGVAARLAVLAFYNQFVGVSDDRATESVQIFWDLRNYAERHCGAINSLKAVEMALSNLASISGHVESPNLSVWEELDIASFNTNKQIEKT